MNSLNLKIVSLRENRSDSTGSNKYNLFIYNANKLRTWSLETWLKVLINPVSRKKTLGVIGLALSEVRKRLNQPQTPYDLSRIKDHYYNINRISHFFVKNRDCQFIGFYGWGEGCRLKAKAGVGISQYDSVIYRKNGQIYIEQIGSSYTLFSKRTEGALVPWESENVMTLFGKVFKYKPDIGKLKKMVFSHIHFNKDLTTTKTVTRWIKNEI